MASKVTNDTLEGFLAFNDPETLEKMKEVARKELGETEELKEECLQKMKELIKEHKVSCIIRDDFLLRYLRTKKFKVQRAFDSLCNYAHQRAAFHKRLMRLRPEVVEKCLRHNILGILPYRDAEERLLFFFTTGAWNINICTDEEIAMTTFVIANYAAENESSQVTGILIIIDDTEIPLQHAPYLLRHIHFGKNFILNCLPMRYKGIHSINESSVVHYCMRLLKPLLGKKILSRVVLHGKTRDAFFQQFPLSTLPNDYGGTLGPLNNDHLVGVILDYLRKMKDEQRYFIQQNH